jgi:hypothetical protein
LELLHAYSLERLAQIVESTTGSQLFRTIRGTVIQWSTAGSTTLLVDSTGIRSRAATDTLYLDFTDAIDASRTESYWVTGGWLMSPDSAAYAINTSNVFAFGNGVIGTPKLVFDVTNGQPAYLEVAYNPITQEVRFYSNGTQVYTGSFAGGRTNIRMSINSGSSGNYTIKDIYVARFEANEAPRLRRWKSVTLPAVTNNIGGETINPPDGSVKSIGATELENTYTIPAGILGLVVQASMFAPDNLSDLVATVKDGTKTQTKRSSRMSNALTQTDPSLGHSVNVGTLVPTAGATTLTVGVKAVDRA